MAGGAVGGGLQFVDSAFAADNNFRGRQRHGARFLVEFSRIATRWIIFHQADVKI